MKTNVKKEYYAAEKRWLGRAIPFLLTAIFLVGSWGTCFSQPLEKFDCPLKHPRFKGGMNYYPDLSCKERAAVMKRVNTIKMWKLTEELDLSEEKADKLFPLIHCLDKEKLKLEKEQDELMKKLRKNLQEGKLTDAELEDIIKKLGDNQSAGQKLKREKFKEIKGILTLEEQARLILFMESFPKEIRRLIREANCKETKRKRRKCAGE